MGRALRMVVSVAIIAIPVVLTVSEWYSWRALLFGILVVLAALQGWQATHVVSAGMRKHADDLLRITAGAALERCQVYLR